MTINVADDDDENDDDDGEERERDVTKDATNRRGDGGEGEDGRGSGGVFSVVEWLDYLWKGEGVRKLISSLF